MSNKTKQVLKYVGVFFLAAMLFRGGETEVVEKEVVKEVPVKVEQQVEKEVKEEQQVEVEEVKEEIPFEYEQALKKGESYLKTMSFSKQGLYDQLTSEFEGFTPEAAQYAVDELFN